MARAVQSSKEYGKHFIFSMPQLSAGHDVYERTIGDRLIAFPPNKSEFHPSRNDKLNEPFTHQLRYDAESVFWLLLWWALHAQPKVDDHPEESLIPYHIMLIFNYRGRREWMFPNFPNCIFHPFYEPLDSLFELMAHQLSGYPEQSKDLSRRKDEYLHEALQRSLFDFLCNNYDESFMTMKISPKSRMVRPFEYGGPPERDPARWRESTPSSEDSEEEDVGHVNKVSILSRF